MQLVNREWVSFSDGGIKPLTGVSLANNIAVLKFIHHSMVQFVLYCQVLVGQWTGGNKLRIGVSVKTGLCSQPFHPPLLPHLFRALIPQRIKITTHTSIMVITHNLINIETIFSKIYLSTFLGATIFGLVLY